MNIDTAHFLAKTSTLNIATEGGSIPKDGPFTGIYNFGVVTSGKVDIETTKLGTLNFAECTFKDIECIALNITPCGLVSASIHVGYANVEEFEATCPLLTALNCTYNEMANHFSHGGMIAKEIAHLSLPGIEEMYYIDLQYHLTKAEARANGLECVPANTNQAPRNSKRTTFVIAMPLFYDIGQHDALDTPATLELRNYMKGLSAPDVNSTTLFDDDNGTTMLYHFTYNVDRAPYAQRKVAKRTAANINKDIQEIAKKHAVS